MALMSAPETPPLRLVPLHGTVSRTAAMFTDDSATNDASEVECAVAKSDSSGDDFKTPKSRRGRPQSRKTLFSRKARKTGKYQGLSTPTSTPRKPARSQLTGLLASLGFEKETATRLLRHLPSKNLRCSGAFWSQEETRTSEAFHLGQRLAVMQLFRAVLVAIAEDVCGADGAMPAINMFALWLNPNPLSSDHEIMARSCLRAAAAARKGTMERRVIRATLCGSFQLRDLTRLAEGIPGGKIGHSSFAKCRADFDLLLSGGALPVQTWTRAKFNKRLVDDAFRLILSHQNVSYLSWGSKRIKHDGVYHDVPSILRKKSVKTIYDQYKANFPSPVGPQPLCMSSFYRVSKVLTNGEMDSRKAVDYVTGFLLNDTFDVLGDMLRRGAPQFADELLPKLEVAKAWLKNGHAGPQDDSSEDQRKKSRCPRHDINFALEPFRRQHEIPDELNPTTRSVDCPYCTSLQKLFDRLRDVVRDADLDPSALQVVSDIQHKADLFMGHKLRVVNQQNAIRKMVDDAKDECRIAGSTRLAILLIDYKMKAEPIYYREKTADHYGKRGMSWHGVQVRTWEKDDESDDPGAIREVVLYYDQLSATDNKQDKGAVVSLLEATMSSLQRDLPQVKRVIVQSDNASCYQNAGIILMLPILGAQHNIQVERYIHTDTQDGKSPLDGHFGQAGSKVRRFVKQGHNCITPAQYIAALAADGGLVNCVPVLVEHNRPVLMKLLKEFKPLEDSFQKLVGRANDVIYSFPRGDVAAAPFHIKNVPDFTLRSFTYSGIGDGVCVSVSPARDMCVHIKSPASHLTNEAVGSPRLGDGTSDVVHSASVDLQDEVLEDREDEIDPENDYDHFTEHETTPPDAHQAVETKSDRAESESEDDLACEPGDETTVLFSTEGAIDSASVGFITGVTVTRTAQLIRKARKWVHAASVVTRLTVQSSALSQRERNLTAYAKQRLLTLVDAGTIGIVDSCEIPDRLIKEASDLPLVSGKRVVRRGWARRPPNGEMYGVKYIELYREDILVMFERGAADKAEKIGAGRMLEALKRLYPHRFNLPSESDIRAEISRLFALKKRKGAFRTSDDPPVKRYRMAQEHVEYLEDLVIANPGIKPCAAVPSFRRQFPECADEVGDKRVREKVSSIKQKISKARPV